MGLTVGHDFTGEGSVDDPFVFAEHMNYFFGFLSLCQELGIDPKQRISKIMADGETQDVVRAGDVSVYFRPPSPAVYEPPMAWILHGPEGTVGDVTWLGGAEIAIKVGPRLKVLLEGELRPALMSALPGPSVDMTMAMLVRKSNGAVRAEKVARAKVLAVLGRR